MNYWLSKRRIQTRVRVERYCASDKHSCFTLLRCPACREIYFWPNWNTSTSTNVGAFKK